MNTKEQPSKPHRLLLLLRKLSVSVAIIFMVTMLQIHWSMGELSDQMSSGCMSCGFFEEAVYISFLTSIFLAIVFFMLGFVKKTVIRIAMEFMFLILIWMLWNHSIFVDRESSWSTYDFQTEMHYTLSLSCIPTIILGCVCIFLLHFKKIKTRIQSTK